MQKLVIESSTFYVVGVVLKVEFRSRQLRTRLKAAPCVVPCGRSKHGTIGEGNNALLSIFATSAINTK
jgi:hypothetical protein